MKTHLKTLAALLAPLAVLAASAADVFSLQNIRDARTFGPFNLRKGEIVRLDGVAFELQTPAPGRVSFKSLANGVVYGPIQVVDGRLGVVGNATYSVRTAVRGTPPARAARPNDREPFVPQPPAMPELIDVPEPEAQRTVPPKDLPALPESPPLLRATSWLAPVDHTPADWKIDSSKAGDGALERISLGGDVIWNNWVAGVILSPMVKCDDIASGGSGITGASFKDGTGWSLAAGYRRPFLVEGGWTARAGLRGQIRQDSGDLHVHTALHRSVTDTNGVDNVVSERRTQTSSVTIRELSLWIDLELAYDEDLWGAYANLSIQPVSSYDISGSIRYGSDTLSLDAERSMPLNVTLGGWFLLEPCRLFADITVGADRRFRLGCGFDL